MAAKSPSEGRSSAGVRQAPRACETRLEATSARATAESSQGGRKDRTKARADPRQACPHGREGRAQNSPVNDSITLGRIAGIRVGVNWSWLVVFALIVWTLSESIFPRMNPGLSDATYLGMAIAAALLFFVSLLMHEYGHALVARREGMEIDGITLWLFGGVARFKGMFRSAGAEFRIAIAGPIVSLALGLAFVLL